MCQAQYDITYEDLNPTFLFVFQTQRLKTEHPHSHDFIEIVLILDGEGEFYLDGALCPVRKGDILLLNPGTVHQSRFTHPESPALEFYAAFTNVHFRNMEENRICFSSASSLIHPKEKTFLSLSRLAAEMNVETEQAHPGRYFMLKSCLMQMILLLYRAQTECPKTDIAGYTFESTNKKYVVEQIVDYMDQHYNEKISLDRIAENMYLSPFYISRIFKSEIGTTPINYLINMRMEKAKQLLKTRSDASVQEIAECVGYEDAYHFSKLFKKHYGESPTKYRQGIQS
ncbi:MAG: helix-turn-helix domain-containing protein [Fusicatenibacter sp.]